jgi:hypothetical protein
MVVGLDLERIFRIIGAPGRREGHAGRPGCLSLPAGPRPAQVP